MKVKSIFLYSICIVFVFGTQYKYKNNLHWQNKDEVSLEEKQNTWHYVKDKIVENLGLFYSNMVHRYKDAFFEQIFNNIEQIDSCAVEASNTKHINFHLKSASNILHVRCFNLIKLSNYLFFDIFTKDDMSIFTKLFLHIYLLSLYGHLGYLICSWSFISFNTIAVLMVCLCSIIIAINIKKQVYKRNNQVYHQILFVIFVMSHATYILIWMIMYVWNISLIINVIKLLMIMLGFNALCYFLITVTQNNKKLLSDDICQRFNSLLNYIITTINSWKLLSYIEEITNDEDWNNIRFYITFTILHIGFMTIALFFYSCCEVTFVSIILFLLWIRLLKGAGKVEPFPQIALMVFVNTWNLVFIWGFWKSILDVIINGMYDLIYLVYIFWSNIYYLRMNMISNDDTTSSVYNGTNSQKEETAPITTTPIDTEQTTTENKELQKHDTPLSNKEVVHQSLDSYDVLVYMGITLSISVLVYHCYNFYNLNRNNNKNKEIVVDTNMNNIITSNTNTKNNRNIFYIASSFVIVTAFIGFFKYKNKI